MAVNGGRYCGIFTGIYQGNLISERQGKYWLLILNFNTNTKLIKIW